MSTAFFFLKININSTFLVNFDRLLKGTIPKLRSFASFVFPTRLVEVRAKNGVLDPKCEVGFKIEGSVGDWDIKCVEGGGSDPELGISDLHDLKKLSEMDGGKLVTGRTRCSRSQGTWLAKGSQSLWTISMKLWTRNGWNKFSVGMLSEFGFDEMFKITRNMASKRIAVFMDNLYEGMDEEWMEQIFSRYVE
ncbi:hypothetical protein RHGRI_032233 [Rhododendron griersonianum]|uniref:Uncharacterized protein n=1 Tax=Rhododendron griersonianum TaxID=479676 RepID=A0AAV6IGS2_9ERIC|nr:hypothetical protein RHGRI_032233 [Rhododendron griersonianum]